MRRLCTVLLVLATTNGVHAQESAMYVSAASQVIGTYQPVVDSRSPEAMAAAGKSFLGTLDEQQRELACHVIDSAERRKWTNLPARPNAGGVALGNCNGQQLEAFCDLLATLTSDYGYRKMCHVMLADDQLLQGGRARPGFGTEQFSVVVFDEPTADRPWGFQLDGHHLGFNVSVEGEKVTISPSFIGTQPQAFQIGDEEYQPLRRETNGAYALIGSFTEEQRQAAVLATRRGQVKSGPGTDGEVPKLGGVSCATFDTAQRDLILSLVEQWVAILPEQHAQARMKQIATQLNETKFAWHGETTEGSDISYSIQGPTLIIEYACQDLGGDPLNHLHTMYRDPTNEYGGQLQ